MTLHPFEARGLGQAPFKFVGLSQNVSKVGDVEVAGGTCDFCGTGIRWECRIRSHDGKTFVVGTDCVRKLDREDNALVSAVERAIHEQERQKRADKKRAEYEQKRAAIEAELAAERERNGGLTDYEVEQQRREREQQEKELKIQEENSWLLATLRAVPYASDFVQSMIAELGRKPVQALSDRCQEILGDIYAKAISGSRRNSRSYNAALETFYKKIESSEPASN